MAISIGFPVPGSLAATEKKAKNSILDFWLGGVILGKRTTTATTARYCAFSRLLMYGERNRARTL